MLVNQKEQGKFTYVLFLLLFTAVFVVPLSASAAAFLLNPSSGSYAVGSTVPVDVIIDTESASINAVSGMLTYDVTAVKPVSIKIADSLVDLWIVQPSISASEEAISFEGLILNPGFTGKGKIATINFTILAPSSSVVSFASGSALANDGLGTNLLARFAKATLSTYGAEGETIATRDLSSELPIDPSTLVLDSLRPPVVTSYTLRPENITKFSLQGVTYPEAGVKLWLQKDTQAPDVLTLHADKAGNFSYQHDSPFADLEPLLPASVLTAVKNIFSGTHYRFWLSATVLNSETPTTQAFDMVVGGISMTEVLIAFLIIIVLLLGTILVFQMTSLKGKLSARLKKKKHTTRHPAHG